MCFDYDEYAVMGSDTIVRAGRRHRCWLCRGVIHVNEFHAVTKWLFDGHWGATRYCDKCERLRLAVVARETMADCHGAWPCPEDLAEYLKDAAAYDKPVRPLGLPTLFDCRLFVYRMQPNTPILLGAD